MKLSNEVIISVSSISIIQMIIRQCHTRCCQNLFVFLPDRLTRILIVYLQCSRPYPFDILIYRNSSDPHAKVFLCRIANHTTRKTNVFERKRDIEISFFLRFPIFSVFLFNNIFGNFRHIVNPYRKLPVHSPNFFYCMRFLIAIQILRHGNIHEHITQITYYSHK